MDRRKFIQLLGIAAALTLVPLPAIGEKQQYQLKLDLPSHGVQGTDGTFQFNQRRNTMRKGDVVTRLGIEQHSPFPDSWKFERLYNETQDCLMWFVHIEGIWSDRKHLWKGPQLDTWFERV